MFNYRKFKKKFIDNNEILSSCSYYEQKYLYIKYSHMFFLINQISMLLVDQFNDSSIKKLLDSYNVVNRLFRENGLSESERKKFFYKTSLLELDNYLHPDANFIENKFSCGFDHEGSALFPVDRAEEYFPFIRELIKDRACVILSYIYNHIKRHISNIVECKIFVPLQPPEKDIFDDCNKNMEHPSDLQSGAFPAERKKRVRFAESDSEHLMSTENDADQSLLKLEGFKKQKLS